MKYIYDIYKSEAKNVSGLEWPLGQVMIADNVKILYCPIAKNACTSLKKMMVKYSDSVDVLNILDGDIHRNLDLFNTGLQLKDLEREKVDVIINSDEYFRFTILREPVSRILSAYIEKFVLHRMKQEQWVHIGPVISDVRGINIDDVDYNKGITFREFVDHILSKNPSELDPHWRPQYQYMQGIDYKYLYSINNIDKLEYDLRKHTKKRIKIEHENRTEKGTGCNSVVNAVDIFPNEIANMECIAKESFMDPVLISRIRDYYYIDSLLYNCAKNNKLGYMRKKKNKTIYFLKKIIKKVNRRIFK